MSSGKGASILSRWLVVCGGAGREATPTTLAESAIRARPAASKVACGRWISGGARPRSRRERAEPGVVAPRLARRRRSSDGWFDGRCGPKAAWGLTRGTECPRCFHRSRGQNGGPRQRRRNTADRRMASRIGGVAMTAQRVAGLGEHCRHHRPVRLPGTAVLGQQAGQDHEKRHENASDDATMPAEWSAQQICRRLRRHRSSSPIIPS